jgi:hypothetical protein
VNYTNAHATSTPVGDLAEVRAIKQAFNNTSEIKIKSTKVCTPLYGTFYFNANDSFYSWFIS